MTWLEIRAKGNRGWFIFPHIIVLDWQSPLFLPSWLLKKDQTPNCEPFYGWFRWECSWAHGSLFESGCGPIPSLGRGPFWVPKAPRFCHSPCSWRWDRRPLSQSCPATYLTMRLWENDSLNFSSSIEKMGVIVIPHWAIILIRVKV